MGLFDNFSLDNLDDPKNASLLAAGLSMMAPKPYRTSFLGDVGQSGLVGLQTLAAAKQQERANRQNDLQQMQGLFTILQNNESMRWAAAKQAGVPYTPSPEYLALQAKIAKASGLSSLASPSTPGPAGSSPLPATQPAVPAIAPGVAAPSASPMANPGYQPPVPGMVRPNAPTPAPANTLQQSQADGFGAPAGGLDMADYMMAANNPGLKMYTEQYAKDHGVQNVRQGGYVVDGNGKVKFYAPKLGEGMQVGANNEVSPMTGYMDALSAIEGTKASASTKGKQAETYVDVPIGNGQTMRMTNAQYEASRAAGRLSAYGSPPIPQSVIDADKSGQPFNATQTPDGKVQFNPPPVAKVTPMSAGGGGGLGVTPNPVAQAGAMADVESGAKNRQKVMMDDYQNLAGQNANAQTVISRLQTIKQLGPQALTGAEVEKRDFFNGLLSLVGVKSANDAKTAGDLIDKNAAQIALAIGAGSNGTDALRALAQTANPSRHMTLEAMQKAVNSLVAPLQMTQAKTQLLTPQFSKLDAATYLDKKQAFERAADPRVWELQSLPPQDQQAYVSGLSPADAQHLLAARSRLRELGVLQ